jgi:acetylornithine/succinyldiaminopimelate/putrescine aminotransferase
MGLMIGVEMKNHAKGFQGFALENGILVNVCHTDTVRLIPPLMINESEAGRLTESLQHYSSKYK